MASKSTTPAPAPAPAPDAASGGSTKPAAALDGFGAPTVFATLGHPEGHLDVADPDD